MSETNSGENISEFKIAKTACGQRNYVTAKQRESVRKQTTKTDLKSVNCLEFLFVAENASTKFASNRVFFESNESREFIGLAFFYQKFLITKDNG